jgi:hypothetical protein
MEPLQVKSKSAERREKRTATCREVFNHFHLQLFELNMLCFIDDEDDGDADYEEERSRVLGVSNRGGFIRDLAMAFAEGVPLPRYVKECLFGADGTQLFQRLLYVHGSASEPEESLIITLSHELQHFLQWRDEPQASEADGRLRGRLNNWQEHPSEHQAMLVSKQVATIFCGEPVVRAYTDSRIELAIQNQLRASASQQSWRQDQVRWEFFRALETSATYDFAKEVARLSTKHDLSHHE